MLLRRRVREVVGDGPPPLASGLGDLTVVDEVIAPGSRYAPQRLERLVLFLTVTGTAQVEVDGRVLRHRPGTVVALARGVTFAERVAARPWRVRYLMLTGPWAEEAQEVLAAVRGLALRTAASARAAFAEAMDAALDAAVGWRWRLAAATASMLGEVVTAIVAGDPSGTLITHAARLVDGEPERAWRSAELAAALGTTPAALHHRFVAAVGEPPARWVRRRRIEHARRLLAGGLGVAETADRLGFANPYHFSRVFTRTTGMTPSTIRRAMPPSPLHEA